MPIYVYKCDACDTDFDAERAVEDRDRFTPCPKCHSGKLQRQITAPNLSGLSTRGPKSTYVGPGRRVGIPPLRDDMRGKRRGKKGT